MEGCFWNRDCAAELHFGKKAAPSFLQGRLGRSLVSLPGKWPRAFPAKFWILTSIFLRSSAQVGIPSGALAIPAELGARTTLAVRSSAPWGNRSPFRHGWESIKPPPARSKIPILDLLGESPSSSGNPGVTTPWQDLQQGTGQGCAASQERCEGSVLQVGLALLLCGLGIL